jgi:hypothetical protein
MTHHAPTWHQMTFVLHPGRGEEKRRREHEKKRRGDR